MRVELERRGTMGAGNGIVGFFFFFFFFFESGLLSVEAGPHVGLYIVVRYSSGS
jgi:hypothetical protein